MAYFIIATMINMKSILLPTSMHCLPASRELTVSPVQNLASAWKVWLNYPMYFVLISVKYSGSKSTLSVSY